MRASTLVALLAALAVVPGCGSSDDDAGAQDKPAASSNASAASVLRIAEFKYEPVTLTAKAGATIPVRNEDEAAHTVTAEDEAFDSGSLKAGASGRVKAPGKAGTYAYICAFHPFMRGKLVVR